MPIDDQPAPVRVCGAPGCHRPLTPGQLKNKAQVCSVRCRVRAFRGRQRAAVLAHIDRVEAAQARRDAEVGAELAELRAQVARLG